MSQGYATLLSIDRVREIAMPILKKAFGRYGLGEVTARDEEDWDGFHVIRMWAPVKKGIPTRKLIDTNAEIQTALREHGDDRYLYLSAVPPGGEEDDEDVE